MPRLQCNVIVLDSLALVLAMLIGIAAGPSGPLEERGHFVRPDAPQPGLSARFEKPKRESCPRTGVRPSVVSGADVNNVDFGFNFDTIVNTNDADQGSLRQFLLNSNELDNTNLDQEDNPPEIVPRGNIVLAAQVREVGRVRVGLVRGYRDHHLAEALA